MTPFVLDISLRSPIILSYRTMLDSLLIGLGYERYGAASTVREQLPLRCTHGVPHASQLLVGVPDVPMVRSATFIQSMIRVLSNNTLLALRKMVP